MRPNESPDDYVLVSKHGRKTYRTIEELHAATKELWPEARLRRDPSGVVLLAKPDGSEVAAIWQVRDEV